MKKTIFAGILLASLFVFSACSTTSSNTKFKAIDDGTEKQPANGKTKQFVLFKYGNIGDYFTIDESSVFTETALGTVKQKKLVVTVDPKKKTAGFGSPYMAAYYYLFMDASSRAKLTEAMSKYLEDFENKNLERKGKHEQVYGKIPVNLRWGTLSNSTPNDADAKMLVGYKFDKKSPYFSITIYPAMNKFHEVVDTVDTESMTLCYFFTRSQIKEFCSIMTEENIQKTIIENSDIGNKGLEVQSDSYSDEDEYSEAEVK